MLDEEEYSRMEDKKVQPSRSIETDIFIEDGVVRQWKGRWLLAMPEVKKEVWCKFTERKPDETSHRGCQEIT